MLVNEYTTKLINFDPETDSYNKRNALFLGEASQAAYGSPDPGDPNGMRAWAAFAGFTTCDPFVGHSGFEKLGEIAGFVAKTENLLLVAFRGTDPTVGDWLIDFETEPESGSPIPGRVHRGFQSALVSVWSQIRPHLDARGNRRVWITGHSLGGALAVACAARSTFEAPRVGIRGIYTYGQPRYGNPACSEACADLLGSVLFRHVNNRDLVPRVPPFFLDFRHWGAEILFDHAGNSHFRASQVESLGSVWWQIAVNPLDLTPLRNILHGHDEKEALLRLKEDSFEVVDDHFMATAYLPVLRKEAGAIPAGPS